MQVHVPCCRRPYLVLNELPRIIKLQIPFGLIVLAAIGHSRALPVDLGAAARGDIRG